MKAQDAASWDAGPRDFKALLKDLQSGYRLMGLDWNRPEFSQIGPPEGTPARAHWLERKRIREARKKARR